MLEKRAFDTLGRVQFSWLDAVHHFSFGHYFDPKRLGWGTLRVWNDDTIKAQSGFGRHPHRDMEIITYVRSGAITHRDSLGHEGRTEAGNVQVMSAGTGIEHAEMNLEDETTQLFQIWIEPKSKGIAPRWDAAEFPKADRAGRFVTLAGGRGTEGLPIHQDADVLGAVLTAGSTLSHALEPGRYAYLVPATGRISVNGTELGARDGLAIHGEDGLDIHALEDSDLLLVDTV